MLATTRWGAVMAGMGSGLLSLSAVAVLVWLVLSASGVDGEMAVGGATSFGTIAGFVVAGAVAGRRATLRPPFHGALAALFVAAVVTVVSLQGGSPAPTLQVLLLAAFAIVLGGGAGWMARRRTTPADRSQVGREG